MVAAVLPVWRASGAELFMALALFARIMVMSFESSPSGNTQQMLLSAGITYGDALRLRRSLAVLLYVDQL